METLVRKSFAETGDLEVNKFSGKLNAKAFQILTDGIYSDKITALIRELSTNAVDSQIEAKVDRSFDVHLPTGLNPIFYVRDYGTGMDEDMILNTYTVFFESTKDKCNDFTGCLGLGSKTPLHYNTKSFTVNSWKDGKHYIYSFFMGNGGIPSFTKLLEEPTTEPNGVKVEFPVNRHDVDSFHDRAVLIYSWFNVKPKFIGKQAQLKTYSFQMEKDDWKLSSELRGAKVLMGNILYPVEQYKSRDLDKFNSLINSGILIEAKIGDVEFDVSREHLSYTPRTVKYLIEKFSKIQGEYRDQLQVEIDKCDSYYGAQKKFLEISNNRLTAVFGLDFRHFKFKGKQLTGHVTVDMAKCKILYKSYYRKSIGHIHVTKPTYDLQVGTNLLVFINDTKFGHLSRIKDYISNLSNGKDYYMVVYTNEQDAMDDLQCLNDGFVKISTLPVPVRAARTGKKRGSIGVWPVFNYNAYITKCWTDQNVDIDNTKGLYVIRNGYHPILNGQKAHQDKLETIYGTYRAFDKTNKVLIGCSAKDEAKLIKAGWISVEKASEDIKTTDSYKKAYIDQIMRQYEYNKLSDITANSYYSRNIITYNFKHILNMDVKCDVITEFKTQYKQMSDNSKGITDHPFEAGLFEKEIQILKIGVDKRASDVKMLISKLKEKYPLFSQIDFSSTKLDLILPYVIGVNSVSGQN